MTPSMYATMGMQRLPSMQSFGDGSQSFRRYDSYDGMMMTMDGSIGSSHLSLSASMYDAALILPLKHAFKVVDVIMDAFSREFGPNGLNDNVSFEPTSASNLSPLVARLGSEMQALGYYTDFPSPILISEMDEEEFIEKLVDCLGNLLNGSEDWENGLTQQRGNPENPIRNRILTHGHGFEIFKSLANGSIFRRLQARKNHYSSTILTYTYGGSSGRHLQKIIDHEAEMRRRLREKREKQQRKRSRSRGGTFDSSEGRRRRNDEEKQERRTTFNIPQENHHQAMGMIAEGDEEEMV